MQLIEKLHIKWLLAEYLTIIVESSCTQTEAHGCPKRLVHLAWVMVMMIDKVHHHGFSLDDFNAALSRVERFRAISTRKGLFESFKRRLRRLRGCSDGDEFFRRGDELQELERNRGASARLNLFF